MIQDWENKKEEYAAVTKLTTYNKGSSKFKQEQLLLFTTYYTTGQI